MTATISILATIPGYTPNGWRYSTLSSDAYKFSMMAGGRPLEDECFHLSFRRGGMVYMPVDIDTVVEGMQPTVSDATLDAETEYLNANGFPVKREWLENITMGAWATVYSTPKGEYACPREPVATIRAAQALDSWLEPMLIGRISYQMQVATAYLNACSTGTHDAFNETVKTVTCEEQKRLTLEAIAGCYPNGGGEEDVSFYRDFIQVDEVGYYNAVQAQCRKMLATGVKAHRFFEVGLRAATCMDQHLIALKAMKDMGFTKTSNVYGAWLLGMTPVGTMGHEGVMRWGGDDELAFRKHRDVLPKVTFLLDTNDTLNIGLPIALKLMLEAPDRMDGARPDSGDLAAQFRIFVAGQRENGIARPWIFEDGINDTMVTGFEALRNELDYPEDLTLYGAGGFFIDRCEPTGYTRGRINMIYKLCWTRTYGAAMKFGNEEESGDSGKASLPGIPVVYVKADDTVSGPAILVGQECDVLPGYRPFGKGDSKYRQTVPSRPALSGLMLQIIDTLTKNRVAKIAAARSR